MFRHGSDRHPLTPRDRTKTQPRRAPGAPAAYTTGVHVPQKPASASDNGAAKPVKLWKGLAIVLYCASCGKANDVSQTSTSGADSGSRAQACNTATPIPQHHRTQAQSCPADRGSISPIDTAACSDLSGLVCKTDADCTAGNNGRCLLNADPCRTYCSYDECITDIDCPQKQPCACRGSGSETAANTCIVGSTCSTDADCATCNFCSLSVQPTLLQCTPVDACMQGACDASDAATRCACVGITSEAYACHSPSDECIDDSDCPGDGGYCSYVQEKKHWVCRVCPVQNFM